MKAILKTATTRMKALRTMRKRKKKVITLHQHDVSSYFLSFLLLLQ